MAVLVDARSLGLLVVAIGALFVASPAAAETTPAGALTQLESPFNCASDGGGSGCGTSVPGSFADPLGVAVSPDGRNVYASGAEGIVVFSRELADGGLQEIQCVGSVGTPPCETSEVADELKAVAVAPDGSSVYAVSNSRQAILEYERNPESGLLAKIGCITHEASSTECLTVKAKGMASPEGLVVSPDGKNVYVTSGSDIAEFERNIETGELTQLKKPNECVGEPGSECEANKAIGVADAIGIAMSDEEGKGKNVYVASGGEGAEGDVAAFERDESTGALSQLPGEEGCIGEKVAACTKGEAARAINGSTGVVVSADGSDVYVAATSDSALATLERLPSGALEQLPQAEGCVMKAPEKECGKAIGIEKPRAVALSPRALAASEVEQLYVAGSAESSVAAFERQSSGALTQLGSPHECVTANNTGCGAGSDKIAGLHGAADVAVSPDGTNAYAAGEVDSAVAEFARSVTPAVTGVGPSGGPPAGHTEVALKGSGFVKGATVDFGGTPASNVTVNSASSITATSPPGSGAVDVTVADTSGTSEINPADVYVYGRLGGLDLAGYCVGLGYSGGAEVSGGGPGALDWVCVGSLGEKVSITPSGAPPSMNSACSVEFPEVPTHAVAEEINNANSWNCYEGAPAPEPPAAGETKSPTTAKTATSGALGAKTTVAASVPPPVLAVTGNVAPVSGTVLVKLPGSKTFVPLASLRQIPFGTLIEATHGRVLVTTAAPHGGTQTGEFFQGEFVLTQGHNGLVEATLAGGNFAVCPTARERAHKARAHAATSGKHPVRKLWANAHGSFSTKGNYAAGAVQGTEWLTEDLCDGTIIKVTRDKVAVTNLVNHRHVEVTTGHKYLAKAP